MVPVSLLITGITGYLGSHLAQACVRQDNITIIGLVRFESDKAAFNAQFPDIQLFTLPQLKEWWETHRVDAVCHTSADYGKTCSRNALWETNVTLPLTLLDLLYTQGQASFINIDTILPPEVSAYAQSKRVLSNSLARYSDRLKIANVKLDLFYGPGLSTMQFMGQLLADLLAPKPVLPLTLGEQMRHLVYIDDVVAGLRLLLHHLIATAPDITQYALGQDEPVTIKHIVQLARELTQNTTTDCQFGALPYRPHEMMRPALDSTAIRELGWRPAVSLEAGIGHMIAHEQNRRHP